jgi:hypothetical protein
MLDAAEPPWSGEDLISGTGVPGAWEFNRGAEMGPLGAGQARIHVRGPRPAGRDAPGAETVTPTPGGLRRPGSYDWRYGSSGCGPYPPRYIEPEPKRTG